MKKQTNLSNFQNPICIWSAVRSNSIHKCQEEVLEEKKFATQERDSASSVRSTQHTGIAQWSTPPRCAAEVRGLPEDERSSHFDGRENLKCRIK
jgi:hypothetical protein